MSKRFIGVILLSAAFTALLFFIYKPEAKTRVNDNILKSISSRILPSPTPTLAPIPVSHVIPLRQHVFQSFNNCGPAALSMALSYYGIDKSQQALGDEMRPYQIPGGNNDDKSVTLEELAEKSKEFGLTPFHRPNGNEEILKRLIAQDLPVITRTWTKPNEDIGHYRVVRGYNDTTRELTQDDSLQNKDLRYSYQDFNEIWKKFNYEYLVMVPSEKLETVKQILGNDADEKTAWEKAVDLSRKTLEQNPEDIYAGLNLSVALYETGDYGGAATEFEKVESKLPFRTLWYQAEPIKAYYELGNYGRVFQITDKVLNNHNRAYSDLYLIRGKSYLKQDQREAARQEFEKAVFYNKNLTEARLALDEVN